MSIGKPRSQEGGYNNEGEKNKDEARQSYLQKDGKSSAQGEWSVSYEQRGHKIMTRYFLWRSCLPSIKIWKTDREQLLTPLKILKEAGCSPSEIAVIEVQRTFPIDAKELDEWYYRTEEESNAKKRHNQEYLRYCKSQIKAACEAAKIGEEITSIKIWVEERRREWARGGY